MGLAMNSVEEARTSEPERTPAAYRRDLYRARLVIGQLRDEALATGEPFHVADLALTGTQLRRLPPGGPTALVQPLPDFN